MDLLDVCVCMGYDSVNMPVYVGFTDSINRAAPHGIWEGFCLSLYTDNLCCSLVEGLSLGQRGKQMVEMADARVVDSV